MELQGNTTNQWSDFLGGLRQLSLDVARHKLIDVERASDDNNLPDQADLRYGLGYPVAGGMSVGGWLVLGVVVVVGGLLLRRLAS
jgi:hypothetical protein